MVQALVAQQPNALDPGALKARAYELYDAKRFEEAAVQFQAYLASNAEDAQVLSIRGVDRHIHEHDLPGAKSGLDHEALDRIHSGFDLDSGNLVGRLSERLVCTVAVAAAGG